MNKYKIIWEKSAVKEIKVVPKYIAQNLIEIIDEIHIEPIPLN